MARHLALWLVAFLGLPILVFYSLGAVLTLAGVGPLRTTFWFGYTWLLTLLLGGLAIAVGGGYRSLVDVEAGS
jgi:hypothetical protein